MTKWQIAGGIRDCPRGGPQEKVPEFHYRCIAKAMTGNDELTASDVKDILSERFGRTKV